MASCPKPEKGAPAMPSHTNTSPSDAPHPPADTNHGRNQPDALNGTDHALGNVAGRLGGVRAGAGGGPGDTGRALVVALTLATLGALAACGSGAGTTPPRPATPAIPTITGDPLNMTHAAGEPCTLARPDQLAQYRLVVNGVPTNLPSTPGHTVAGCGWTPTTPGLPGYQAGVDITSGGIATLYNQRSRLAVFQPTSVSEYPAVHTAANPTALMHGQCTVDVGVANDTLLVVRVTVPNPASLDYSDPCPDADSFAATVIANAEGKAP
jgi:hypothetical protein